ncbi:hypothetical protein FA95DRAFT_1602818 [Auriscalpium vulgare]|uniref:Uncharacterized protein n=1 Tax=Auriscalpium vulgare TaxID=40419 RepID=A0ACB8S5N2_9AGAM|nr:hypothetical protein FA95DRAFT_1602818 [Auriscalpium vulgare]
MSSPPLLPPETHPCTLYTAHRPARQMPTPPASASATAPDCEIRVAQGGSSRERGTMARSRAPTPFRTHASGAPPMRQPSSRPRTEKHGRRDDDDARCSPPACPAPSPAPTPAARALRLLPPAPHSAPAPPDSLPLALHAQNATPAAVAVYVLHLACPSRGLNAPHACPRSARRNQRRPSPASPCIRPIAPLMRRAIAPQCQYTGGVGVCPS